MDSQYLTPKMMEQHPTLLRHLKSETVAPMPLSTLKTARSALRSSGYNLQANRESSYMDDDHMLYHHQTGAPYYNPNIYQHPPSYFDCAPVKNNVQCAYEFLEDNRNSSQKNQIYCNTSANCVPQEAMDALKWAIQGIQQLKVLPKQEILSQPFDKSERGKEVNFDLPSLSGDSASNRIDIKGPPMSEQATKKHNSETEKDMQLNQLIDLVRLTILKLDSYITLSQKEQQQMNQNQQGNQLNIEPYLMSSELRPHVDMITDPALQSMLFNKVRQKVRMKRTVKVMPVQPLVIIQPSTPPPPPDAPSTQAANTTRPTDRHRVRKRRRHGGIESTHDNSVKKKRDCGTTMWCPNPDCGLSSQQQELRLDLPQSQSCGTRQTKKNIMSVAKEMDMRSTALPKLLKKLLRENKYCDEQRSESPLSYTEDVQEEQQQLADEQEVQDSDQDWEYPTKYREYELQTEEEEWSHLPDNMCGCCKCRQRETSEASSQVDCPKRKQRKCVRSVQKSSLKSKCCNKVKFNKRVSVKNLTDDEQERCKCVEYKKEREAPSGRTRSSKCRVLKSMWEADQKRSSLAEEYSRRSKGGAESMLPSHYPTKWTQ